MARGGGVGGPEMGCLGQHLETAPLLGAGLISPSSGERKTGLCTEPPGPWVPSREKLIQSRPGYLLSHLRGLQRSHMQAWAAREKLQRDQAGFLA